MLIHFRYKGNPKIRATSIFARAYIDQQDDKKEPVLMIIDSYEKSLDLGKIPDSIGQFEDLIHAFENNDRVFWINYDQT